MSYISYELHRIFCKEDIYFSVDIIHNYCRAKITSKELKKVKRKLRPLQNRYDYCWFCGGYHRFGFHTDNDILIVGQYIPSGIWKFRQETPRLVHICCPVVIIE